MIDTSLRGWQTTLLRQTRRRVLRSVCRAIGVATLLTLSQHSMAQSSKVMRIVVPYAPGGGTDILTRHLADALASELGSPVIVENRGGASGNIGGDAVAKSASDGSTLLMGDLALAVNPSLFKRMTFDPLTDLQPIAAVASAPLVLVVNPSLDVHTVKELVDYAKAHPGKLSFATAGNGNPPHIAGELFRSTTGIDILQVPYKGVGPALIDVIGGQISMLFTGLSSARPQIEAGKVRALAVTGEQRAPTLPTVPTMAEAGFPKVNVTSWWGLFGPAGIPRDSVTSIESATQKALRSPQLRDRLASQAIDVWEGDATSLGNRLASETERWRKVLEEAGIAPE